MANQLEPHETLTFPRVEGHENAHDIAITLILAMEYFVGVSALFHRIVPRLVAIVCHLVYDLCTMAPTQ